MRPAALTLFAAITLSSCCTTYMVHDPKTGEMKEEKDCLGPVETIIGAPLVWLVWGFN